MSGTPHRRPIFSPAGSRISAFLGGSRLGVLKEKILGETSFSKEFLSYYIVHSLYLIGAALSTIFINIFLFRNSSGIETTLLFNIVNFAFMPVGALTAGIFGKRYNLSAMMRSGIAVLNLLYLFLLIFQENVVHYAYIVGMLNGFYAGLYFLGQNTMLLDFTQEDNRDAALSLNGFTSTFAGLVCPLLASLIISAFSDLTGYMILFAVCFALFLTACVLSFKIPKVHTKTKFNPKELIVRYFTNRDWFFALCGDFMRNIREGVMSFIINILMFSVIRQELLIGVNSFIGSVLTLALYVYLTKRISPQNRKQYYLGASIVLFVSSIPLLFGMNMPVLFGFGLINTVTNLVLFNTSVAMGYQTVGSHPEYRERRIEAMVIRELFTNLGRISAIAVLFFLPKDDTTVSVYLVLICFVNLFTFFFFNNNRILGEKLKFRTILKRRV